MAAVLGGHIAFLDIVDTVSRVVGEHDGVRGEDVTRGAIADAELWARDRAWAHLC
ncbi:MAG: hypothetical protein ACK5KU_09665 [Beutenbergiaceae bacterium]